jgi:hypothetical protein
MQFEYYPSPPEVFATNFNRSFKNWIPRRGRNGQRLVIDGFFLIADCADITVAGTAVQGEDVWRVWQHIGVEQIDGRLRWDADGDDSRAMCYLLDGQQHVQEYADIGIAANQNLKFMGYIPMTKRFVHAGTDFAMPVEAFKQLVVKGADLGTSGDGIGISGGTVTFTTVTYYVIAKCHEEKFIGLKSEDVVNVHGASSTSLIRVISGGRLQDMTIRAKGASGGASLANLTDVRLANLWSQAELREDLIERYQHDRGASNLNSTIGGTIRSDPHVLATPFACPVLWADGARVLDGPLTSEINVLTTNSVASLRAVCRTVVPRSDTVKSTINRFYGLSDADYRVDTHGKTKRAQSAWSAEDLKFLPLKARDKSIER